MKNRTYRMGKVPRRTLIILATANCLLHVCHLNILGYLSQVLEKFGVSENELGTLQAVIYNVDTGAFIIGSFCFGPAIDRFGSASGLSAACLFTALATLVFGMSRSPLWMIIGRILIGLTSSGIEVSLRVMHEKLRVDVKSLAFTYAVPASASVALAPGLGGILALPVQQYPSIFGNVRFLDSIPIFLPNLLFFTLFVINSLCAFWYLAEPETTVNESTPLMDFCEAKDDSQNCETQVQDGSQSTLIDSCSEDISVASKNNLKIWSKLTSLANRNFVLASLTMVMYWSGKSAFLTIFSLWLGSSRKYGGLGYTPLQVTNIYLWPGLGAMLIDCIILGQINDFFKPRRAYAMWSLVNAFLFSVVVYCGNIQNTIAQIIMLNFMLLGVRTASSGLNATGVILINATAPPNALGVANGTATTVSSLTVVIVSWIIGVLYTWSMGNDQARDVEALGFPFNHCFTFYLTGLLVFIGGVCSACISRTKVK